MWKGHLARHRQDGCATSFISQVEWALWLVTGKMPVPQVSPLLWKHYR
jgi:hypothetical protein